MRLRGIYWACGVLALSAQAWAQTREIHWVFSPLPLVHRAEQNEPKGFLDRMLDEQLIPQLTGYVHRQDLMPLARRTLNLANDPLACSPGLFKTPERESIAHYSAPLVTMLTGGGFFLSRNDKLKRHTDAQGAISLRSMLADPQLSIGVSLGRSYGREVDALLARSDASIAALVTRNSSQANLAKMLRAERIDVALGHSYEASIMTDAGRLKPDTLRFQPILEEGVIVTVHVACHAGAQGAEVIQKVNALLSRDEVRQHAQGYYESLLQPDERTLLHRLMQH